MSRRLFTLLLLTVSGIGFVVPGLDTPADAATWAPADTATIHPGVQTYTDGGQCTANFVFTDGADVLIGQAAHCSSNSESTATNGCDQDPAPLPVGTTQVEIQGASEPGTLVYSSWNTMLANGEDDPDTCEYNDFALVRIDPADVAKVNPSLPNWGGPTGIGTSSTFESVYSTGNSGLRAGLLKPRTGVTLTSSPWSYTVYTVTPGIPGDSGSAVLNSDGQAMGVLVTVALAPLAGSNGVTDIASAIAYARANGFPQLQLVEGTEPFSSSPLNLIG